MLKGRLQAMTNSKTYFVAGAGAFGGWTALHLRRTGARVILADAWGPGNSRSSSGGETRIIRGTYGPDQPYTHLTARAFALWHEHTQRWGKKLFQRTGVLWLVRGDGVYERASLAVLREAGIPAEEISPAEVARRYPQMNPEGVKWAILEPESGLLYARQACQAVAEAFETEGGELRLAAVARLEISGGELRRVHFSDGTSLTADAYVFACGPWLGSLFPDVIGDLVRPTRQDVVFFGTPAGDTRFTEKQLPVWLDRGERIYYGIPGNQWRGFKVADDTRGEAFDPTNGERTVAPEFVARVREFLALRFPALQHAPLVETRVCQYENTPDYHFIVDQHPAAGNCWLVGGGSGHGFKHGPALGEMVAAAVSQGKTPDPFFRLSRFTR
jgi:glycine/D-amino acid oxidase-like deaminating enzyme